LKTRPITIQVLKKDPKQKEKESEDFFVRIQVSDSSAHIGQQITLEYVLYTKIDIRSQKYIEKPEYEGFFAENLRISRSAYKSDIINGSEYYYKVIDRVALFPQQTGNYTFGPVKFRLGAATEGERTGFFFNQRLKYLIAESNAVTIKVGDFGNNAPNSFSGAVGKYEMRIRAAQTRISADDAFNMLMIVKGDGDSRTVNPPEQSFGEDLDNYDPNTISDDSFVSGGRIINEKTFEFIAVPKRTGNHVVQPEFTYFDVDSNRFVTLRGDSIRFFVTPGTGLSKIRSDEKISKKEMMSLSEETSLSAVNSPFFKSAFYWAIIGSILLGLVYLFWKYWKQLLESNIDPKVRKAQAAKQIALQRLIKADELISAGHHKEAFAEISKSFKEYISDKWLIDYSSLNTNSIVEILSSKDVHLDVVDKTKYCLDQCEMAIYAGANPETLSDVRYKVASIIETIEQS